MCYLKNLRAEENIDLDEFMMKGQETEIEHVEEDPNVLLPCAYKQLLSSWSPEQQVLINLFEMVEKNNSLIRTMNDSISCGSQYLEKVSNQTENEIKSLRHESQHVEEEDDSNKILHFNSCLGSKLFGNKKYKYSLELAENFPSVIYKERNFNIDLKMVDSEGKTVRNCNILSLCLAVASSDAEWIHENRAGEAFLKGKTEVDLYKGQASFVKIYAREVSRVYPDGKINLIIYSKPLTLRYSGSGQYEQPICSQDIKPLVISDVVIKAKKKD